ncbi:unnamed protein product [Caenorhabditis bovis]|uniref:Uncharacterized protein n=1 Tax=Caenorhabditis bovis TaxID=2654633 RepID=A0A8S1EK70_9PELO|nr:unnamed protein product [Caenorhabditis bovis]
MSFEEPDKKKSFWDKCVLPKYDVWAEEIIRYVNPNENPLKKCDPDLKPLTELKNGKWKVISDDKKMQCKWRCHTRKSEKANIISDWSSDEKEVNCEIVESSCSKDGKEIYGYLHSQILPVHDPLNSENNNTNRNNDTKTNYDVYVILIDSLSYSQAKRSLPRTLSYFQSHMDAVPFPYMNKVGDNSRPNGVAIWFGKALEKVDRSLFGEPSIEPDWKHQYFCYTFKDNESNIFTDFKNNGYKTLLAEDWAAGTLNWPNCRGFEKPITHHYMRPFQIAYEKSGTEMTKKHLDGKRYCREYHHTLLDYMEQFINAYPDQRKFAWLWATHLGHNSENGIFHSDKDIHNFFLRNRKVMDESFVIILGDHGLRFGSVRSTFVGGLDVNNPFTMISIPKKLRKTTNILDILKDNSRKLQTHYDTRATLLDLLLHQPKSAFLETEPIDIPGARGNSLLRRQPNFERTCRTLPIPMEYCICQFTSTPQNKNSDISIQAGKAITEKVNSLLRQNNLTEKCIAMDYDNTTKISLYDDKLNNASIYNVDIITKKPSEAAFKVCVQY